MQKAIPHSKQPAASDIISERVRIYFPTQDAVAKSRGGTNVS